MLSERDLLIDIIQKAPEGSVWNISSDSWQRIPEVFSEYISFNKIYGWDIFIDDDNRERLIQTIDKEEIFEKIVHQNITFNDEIILKSYDHMTGSYISRYFPDSVRLIEKYKGCEFDLMELKSP